VAIDGVGELTGVSRNSDERQVVLSEEVVDNFTVWHYVLLGGRNSRSTLRQAGRREAEAKGLLLPM